MAPRAPEQAKKIAAIIGAVLRDSEGTQLSAEPEPEETVAAIVAVLRVLRRRSC